MHVINCCVLGQSLALCQQHVCGVQRVCIVGLKEYMVESVDVIKQLIEHSNAARSTGSTGANADSSRSHSIMQVSMDHLNRCCSQAASVDLVDGH